MAEVVVARADELGPGQRKLVEVGGRSIGVFNVDGAYFAVRNRCPHQGGPLCEGTQFAPLAAPAPGQYDRGPDGMIIRCPWHGWEFDVRTGRSWFDPERTRVRAYPVAVRELEAETYPARREGAYVVVELGR
jgi:nitrite reductase/ring-hydroxylating ferredoxin subunit